MIDFLGFAIEALFITDIWVILYIRILTYLNFIHPPILVEQFYRPAAAWPQPFQIPLYLIMMFLSVFTIYCFHFFYKQLKNVLPAILIIRSPRCLTSLWKE